MRILFIANHEVTLYYFRVELIKSLLEDGSEVYLSMPRGEHAAFFENMGCVIADTPITQYGTNPLSELRLIGVYSRLLERIKPDIAVCFTIKPIIYGAIACAAKKTAQIGAVTGLGTAFQKNALFRAMITAMYRLSTRKTACLIFENADSSEKMEKMKIAPGRHVVVSGSGVNLEKHKYEPYPISDATRLLFVGRMMRDKGIFELVQAVEKAHESIPDISLDIIGWCEDECRELEKSIRAVPYINYLGWQEDVHPFIKQCHAVVLPSYHEGMANSLIEAAATGRVVIASDIPGCRETFDEGVTGFGCKAKSADSLCGAIIKFARLPAEKRAEMGVNARRKMENEFDRRNVVEKYRQIIYRCAKGNHEH